MRLPVVLAMDSDTTHFAVKMEQPRKGEMHKLATYLGCAGAIFMPVRNPFFNTIELVFGFVKTHLKQILSHIGEAIVDRDTLQTMLSKCFRRLRQEHLVGMLRIGCYRAGDEVQQAILGAQAADFQYLGDNLLLESATNRLQQAPTPRCALLFNRSAVRYYRCLTISAFSPGTSREDVADEGWVAYTPGYERADADYVCASSDDANLFFVDKEPHDLLDEQTHLLQHSASQRIERLKERLEQRQPTLFVRSFYFHNARIEKLNGHESASLRNSNDRITFIANLRETKGSYTLQMQQQQFSSFRHLAATQLARSAIVGDALSSAVDILQPTQTFVTQAVRANGDLLQALLKWRSLRLRAVLMRSHALRVAEVLVARAGRSVNLRREGGRLRQPDPGDADWELYTASNGLEEHIREHFEDSFAVDLSNAVYHEQCNYDTHSAEADVSSVSERQLLDVMRLGAAAGALVERVLDKVEHELVVACMQRDVRSWGDPEAQLRSVSRVRIRPKLRMSALTLPGLLSFQHQQTPQKTLHWSGRYVGVEPLSQQPEELFLPSTAKPPLKLNPALDEIPRAAAVAAAFAAAEEAARAVGPVSLKVRTACVTAARTALTSYPSAYSLRATSCAKLAAGAALSRLSPVSLAALLAASRTVSATRRNSSMTLVAVLSASSTCVESPSRMRATFSSANKTSWSLAPRSASAPSTGAAAKDTLR